MLTQKITYNGATLTVRRGTVRDRIQSNMVLNALGFDADDNIEFIAKRFYARVVTQTEVVEGELSFPLPPAGASADDHIKAYEHLMQGDAALYDLLEIALYEVDLPPGDPALAPQSEDQKKD